MKYLLIALVAFLMMGAMGAYLQAPAVQASEFTVHPPTEDEMAQEHGRDVAREEHRVPVEADAFVDPSIEGERTDFYPLPVWTHGYQCNSISRLRLGADGNGYMLSCNHYQYIYRVRDVGGTWDVEVN